MDFKLDAVYMGSSISRLGYAVANPTKAFSVLGFILQPNTEISDILEVLSVNWVVRLAKKLHQTINFILIEQ